MSRLSFDTIQAIHRLAREGKSAREIAAELSVSFASVRLHACGLLQSRGRPRLTAAEVQEKHAPIIALQAEGKTYQEIADQLGITRQRVHAIIKRATQEKCTKI